MKKVHSPRDKMYYWKKKKLIYLKCVLKCLLEVNLNKYQTKLIQSDFMGSLTKHDEQIKKIFSVLPLRFVSSNSLLADSMYRWTRARMTCCL